MEAANARLSELHGSHEQRAQHHASLEERIAFLEKDLGDSAEKHATTATELEAAKTRLSELHDGHKQRAEHHASLEERISFIEKDLGDSADKHDKAAKEMEAANARLTPRYSRTAPLKRPTS